MGGKGIDANLKDVFPSDYKNGKVEANWFSGNILAVKGDILVHIYQTFESVYETEIEFSMKDGRLEQVKTYDNSKAYSSSYPGESKLFDFLVANTNHCLLPDTVKQARIYLRIDSVGDNKKIEKVIILKGFSDKCNEEAIRVVKSIPEWEVIYRKGKPDKGRWTLPITFDSSKCIKRNVN